MGVILAPVYVPPTLYGALHCVALTAPAGHLIRENVGAQDQIAAAFGGFNRIEFKRCGGFQVSPVIIPRRRIDELQSHLMLCFTGLARIASEVAQDQIANIGKRQNELHRMRAMVEEAVKILHGQNTPIEQFGALLHDSWMLKKELSKKVSTSEIDQLYDAARDAAASMSRAARRRCSERTVSRATLFTRNVWGSE